MKICPETAFLPKNFGEYLQLSRHSLIGMEVVARERNCFYFYPESVISITERPIFHILLVVNGIFPLMSFRLMDKKSF